jgi:AcrR family transcriptional regulator
MSDRREQILNAAIEVAIQGGILSMTLDEVCKRAEISKGGLIHHYRNKDELLIAMMDHFVGSFEHQIQTIVSQDPDAPHGRIRAMLTTAQALVSGKPIKGLAIPSAHAIRFMMSLLTASANNPPLLKSIRIKFDALRTAMLEDSAPDGHLALVLWMAFDGLMLWHHLGVLPEKGPLGEQLVQRMLHLLDASVAESESGTAKQDVIANKNRKSLNPLSSTGSKANSIIKKSLIEQSPIKKSPPKRGGKT